MSPTLTLILSLAGTGALLGLAGLPHCLAMCGAPCLALAQAGQGSRPGRPWRPLLAWQAGRLVGYATAGALAATAFAALARLGEASALLRPFWLLLQLGTLALGLWLLLAGRWPLALAARLEALAGGALARLRPGRSTAAGPAGVLWLRPAGAGGSAGCVQARPRPLRPVFWGLAWAAWPCGLLGSALLVAAQAPGAAGGAAVMAAFALASGPGLMLGPLLLGGRGGPRLQALALRLAGAVLLLSGAWMLLHGGLHPVQAVC